MKKLRIYQPQYYKKFNCIGSACKNNCCHSWGISIDKTIYDKYMSLDDDAAVEFREKIAITPQEPFEARILLDEDGKCKFLNARGLCSIQARFGPEYLSYTCMTYPRKFCNVNGETEAFLEMSCEVVSKLILFEQNIMRFENAELESNRSIFHNSTMDASKYTAAGNAYDIFWKLRTISILVAQSRNYRLQHRLMILGIFIKQADELISSERDEEISELADRFLERLDTGYYDALIKQAPGAIDLEMNFVLGILKDMEEKGQPLFCKCFENARKGLGIRLDDGELPDSYGNNYRVFYETYFADKEYILENFVVSHIFSDGFPFNYRYMDSLVKNYRELLVKYSLVKFLITGVSRHYMKFDKRKVVECVSSFSRSYDHHVGGALVLK